MEQSERIQLPRLKIIHIMIIAGVLAVVFGVLNSRPSDSTIGLTALGALGGVWFLTTVVRPNPLKVVLANLPDDRDQRIAALEEGLARCNPYDWRTNSVARYRLMELYKVRKRYEDAIKQGRAILATRGVTHNLENEVRVEVAICLDFLGKAEEAELERSAVTDGPDDSADAFVGWRAQGKVLERQRRYEEAVDAYERALELNPPENTEVRGELLIRLVLASFNAGQVEPMMKWAQRAINEDVSDTRLYQAHRLAGSASANLGRLDESHQHRQRAYEMAVKEGEPKAISDCLAAVADLYRLRGELQKAEDVSLEAESLCPGSARTAIIVHAIVLRARGRFDEALARMEQASRAGAMAMASNEGRMQAALKRWIATCQAELGRLDQAWENLSEATAELTADPKLILPCEAAWAWLLALRGDRDAAIGRTEMVLHAIEEKPPDASTQLDALELLGRALIVMGDFERAQHCWEQFLATPHPPVAVPIGEYYLGECRWQLRDPAGAREAFCCATAPGIDSHHARLAERRLGEFSKGLAKGDEHAVAPGWDGVIAQE